ncbi:hypothetical protein HF324_21835 [Chitinophaga oryzae]|uniref:DoxX family protein n=1 Tax=Chitinophaga oryzae TaxID=2725414 RepID=A0AAE6ZJE1_9BACT|nr:hypothetical protein [Chitinophaga oryzae]QJB33832.1 hypothetical protein HF329_21935 [Chitinophaga oryzae]QJB40358.1 hypothetical protein HF324_21835 [Chitinophaga oryzae]
MKPIIILITVFTLALLVSRPVTGDWQLIFAGNLSMCCMLCFTALGHFLFPKGMVMMIPPFVPFKKALVYVTGVAEIVMGILLLVPSLREMTGWVIIIFFLLILPANIYAAIKHVDLEKATYNGPGPGYLWFRVPEQLLFIAWIYFFSIAGF